MLKISNTVSIPERELIFKYIRAQGAGGQHVNKASTAVHLRFDFLHSRALPELYKQRLQIFPDHRISPDGVIVIKAQRFRSQERNREDARFRLAQLIQQVTVSQKKRRPTAPTKASRKRRLESKSKLAGRKQLRKKVSNSDY